MTSAARILLADDEDIFRLSTGDLLRREGYYCDIAADGDEALARLRLAGYDLLLCDLEMPGNEDMRVVRQAAKEFPQLAILIITGFPTTRSAIACVELRVSAYLLKPVDLTELLQQIAQATPRTGTAGAVGNECRIRDCPRAARMAAAIGEAVQLLASTPPGAALPNMVELRDKLSRAVSDA